MEAVPLPDGQLCLLALPPELCEGEGPEAMSYLKLFGRHITDRKVGRGKTPLNPGFAVFNSRSVLFLNFYFFIRVWFQVFCW